MSDARTFAFRVAPAAMMFAFCSLVQPAAAQFRDTVAYTITNAAGETAVPPGCPPSSSLNPFRLTRGSLPARDYHCFTAEAGVRGVAAYYAPYAIQAALAYQPITDDMMPSGATSLGTVIGREFPDRAVRVQKLLDRRGWRFVGPDRCMRHNLDECRARYQPDPMGLAYHVWKRTDARGNCREVSIAFRGSVGSLNAWLSNLQQFIPAFDPEYGQLKREFGDALDDIQAKVPCRQIVTVGHSLGGGLGQFAALGISPAKRIAKVVTFNTSPVSGVNLVDDTRLLDGNMRGLTIDRVNQEGELLSYNFFKQRRQTKASGCNPLIRGVEFNAGTGGSGIPLMSAYEQHRMVPFASRLVALSYTNETADSLVTPKLPPAGNVACGTRYEEQDQELIASARPDNDRQGALGPLMGQQSQDTAVYAYVSDRENAFARLERAKAHTSIARQHGQRSRKIRLARS
ncbi:hypothetical protein [Bradyrhizobium sp. 1]|uniref:hypothetical protein n=1 Tax=Bradyrhizobium sp. 1 TaxID=241591 RepID=UPI001FF89C1A|nr:hypothetical protein [Bradyrhizobium sp. 1]MCK1395803.1 hypothetical protein [Bradyrhizobium sp. 1]